VQLDSTLVVSLLFQVEICITLLFIVHGFQSCGLMYLVTYVQCKSQLFLFVSVNKYYCVYLFLNHGHKLYLTCGLKIILTIFLWKNVAQESALGGSKFFLALGGC
jgi:hypothetical protein